ncbi:MAG: TIGR00366 family protein [Xanthomonadales bacterium]|nr:TIGR00366 family protein [Xanthomonadales bacterium]
MAGWFILLPASKSAQQQGTSHETKLLVAGFSGPDFLHRGAGQLLAYVVPQGQYERVPYPEDPHRNMVVADSYAPLPAEKQVSITPWYFLQAIRKGLSAAHAIIFFIPSGSGQAFVTMPIMSPLATVTGVPQQTVVLAYQFGDGFTNMVIPTSALVMGALALGKIPYGAWVRFVTPLLLKIFALAIVFLVISVRFGEQIGFY